MESITAKELLRVINSVKAYCYAIEKIAPDCQFEVEYKYDHGFRAVICIDLTPVFDESWFGFENRLHDLVESMNYEYVGGVAISYT